MSWFRMALTRGKQSLSSGGSVDAAEFAYTVDLLNLKITPESVGGRELS